MARRSRRRRRCSIEVLDSGTVRVRVRGERPDGRPYDRSESVSCGSPLERRAEAERVKVALWRWAEEVEAGLVVDEQSVTISDLVQRFRREGALSWRPSDASCLKGPLRSFAGIDVRELTDSRWRSWVERMRAAGRSAAYIRSAYSLARRAVGLAVERRMIARLPWTAPQRWLPSESETRTRRALDRSEMSAILEAARSLDREGLSSGALALRLEVAHHTAARPLEVARWGPPALVELAPGVPALRWTVAKSRSGDVREVPLPPAMAEALRAWWNALPVPAQRTGVFFPLKGKRGRWAPRTKRVGRYESGRLLTDAELAALRERSGVADLVSYIVRHTGATDAAAELGMGAGEVQGWMKHKTLRMTSRYVAGRIDPERAALLAKPRQAAALATPAPTVLVVHAGGGLPAGAPEPVKEGRPTGPRQEDRAPNGLHVSRSSRGRGVDATRVETLSQAIPALRELVASAGGPRVWARTTDMDLELVGGQVEDLLSAGAVPELDRGWARQLAAECRAALEGRAHGAPAEGAHKGGEEGGKVVRFPGVRAK